MSDSGRGEGPGLPPGERLSAGSEGKALFAGIFGLNAQGSPFTVESAAWIEDHFEVTVDGKDLGRAVFTIVEKTADAPAYVASEHLAVSHRDREIPSGLGETISSSFPGSAPDMTFARLQAQFAADPEIAKLEVPSGPGPDMLLDTWGSPESWTDFFADGEISRGRLDSMDMPRLFRVIQHGELECAQQAPHEYAPIISMVEYPWDDRVRDMGMPPFVRRFYDPGEEAFEEIMQTTDVTEQDVVRGNPDKIRAILDDVVRQPNPDRKPILFSKTCVSVVTGEDVESEVRRHACDCNVPLLYLTVTRQSSLNLFKDLLVDRRLEAEAAAGPPDPDAVNLVGFPDTRATSEVADLLGAFGIRVNRLVIPDLGTDIIDDVPNASMNIVAANANWRNFYDQLLEGSRIPFVLTTAPYGIEGTKAWLAHVLEAMGREVDGKAVRAAVESGIEKEWREAAARCGRHRLAFVMRGRDIHHLTDPSAAWGVPLVRTVEEMGFGIDVFLYLTGRDEAVSKAAEVQALFARPAVHVIKGFNSFEMMKERLLESDADAAFTNHFFDWRISEAGMNRFSLRQFEMGPAGAVRTARRLADICETPFYRNYHRFLGRTVEGIRMSEAREDVEG